jgi:lipoprotein-anchoring transpeptidase ErfK/SrfK
MLHRSAAVLLALLAAAPALSAQQPQPAAASRFEALFASAQRDPAGVVPLLLEGSRMLASLAPEDARRMGDTLEPFARRAFFTSERLPGMEQLGLGEHVVAKSETPTTIAGRYDIGHGLLPYLNAGFDAKKLRVGQKLKVLDLSHGELGIDVERSTFRLSAWRQLSAGGRVLLLFVPVGLGASDSPTPAGHTLIAKRVLNPSWTDPDTKQVFAPSDPRNVLGGYWIALDAEGLGGRTGIGIHGYTGAPSDDWLQRPGSHGCVRMLQKDVDRLFHLATEGTPVDLR